MSSISWCLILLIIPIHPQLINCNGNCYCPSVTATPGDTCILSCLYQDSCKEMTLTCRAGDPCEIRCTGKASCAQGTTIIANSASNLIVTCSGEDACKDAVNIQCGTSDCELQCYGITSCDDTSNIDARTATSFGCSGFYCPPNLPLPFSPSPTSAPTQSPTPSPTNSTANPTITPSYNPTVSPTAAPSVSPSAAPSFAPTFNPTSAPTFSPTISPTMAPVHSPTSAPTLPPTLAPTKSPTQPPTNEPTYSPTIAPTISPTSAPTFSPSSSPTLSPSASPSSAPTMIPTDATLSPSTSPTMMLSMSKDMSFSGGWMAAAILLLICICFVISMIIYVVHSKCHKELQLQSSNDHVIQKQSTNTATRGSTRDGFETMTDLTVPPSTSNALCGSHGTFIFNPSYNHYTPSDGILHPNHSNSMMTNQTQGNSLEKQYITPPLPHFSHHTITPTNSQFFHQAPPPPPPPSQSVHHGSMQFSPYLQQTSVPMETHHQPQQSYHQGNNVQAHYHYRNGVYYGYAAALQHIQQFQFLKRQSTIHTPQQPLNTNTFTQMQYLKPHRSHEVSKTMTDHTVHTELSEVEKTTIATMILHDISSGDEDEDEDEDEGNSSDPTIDDPDIDPDVDDETDNGSSESSEASKEISIMAIEQLHNQITEVSHSSDDYDTHTNESTLREQRFIIKQISPTRDQHPLSEYRPIEELQSK